jgi:hypothetical protein
LGLQRCLAFFCVCLASFKPVLDYFYCHETAMEGRNTDPLRAPRLIGVILKLLFERLS